jgi:hypothetical protein
MSEECGSGRSLFYDSLVVANAESLYVGTQLRVTVLASQFSSAHLTR